MKKSPQSQFRLSRSNWYLTVLYVLVAIGPYVLLLILRSDAKDIQMEASVTATYVLVITCVTYVVWRFIGRRQGVTTTVFNILIICSIGSRIGSYNDKMETRQKGEEIRAIQQQILAAPPEDPAKWEEVNAGFEQMRDLSVDYTAGLVRQSTGPARDVYTIVNDYMQDLYAVAGEWSAAHDAAFDERVLDYARLSNPQEFAYQRRVIQEYMDKNEEFRHIFVNQAEILRERFGPLAGQQKNAVRILAEMEGNISRHGSLAEDLFLTDRKWGALVLDILDILEREPWTLTEDGPDFTDAFAGAEFDRLTVQHDELLDRSQALAVEFFAVLGGDGGGTVPEADRVQRD